MSKRFANALNRAGRYSTRSRFVIPDPAGGNYFVELATGERHENAAVVLIGVELTIDDVVAKIRANGMDAESAKPVIGQFLELLPEYPIGSVIKVTSGAPDLQLAMVKRRLQIGRRKKLPG
jgi:hypothetical protein